MTRRRGGALCAVALALFTFVGLARAAAPPDLPDVPPSSLRVALLSTIPDDPLAGRLDAELRAIGVDVARAAISPERGIEEQVRAALAAGTKAVVVADGHRTDVWIAQVGSDRVGLRQELEVDESSGLQAVLALRTVEFLRISLGLVSAPPVAPLSPAPPVARAVPVAPEPRRWFTVDATSGALGSAGGGGIIAIAGISLRGQLAGMVGAELSFYAPLTEADLTAAAGEARTSVWMAGGGVLLAPRPDRRMSFDLGAGTLATVVRSTGVVTGPLSKPATSQVTRAAIYGRGAARLRLAPRLSLRIDVFGGTLIDPPAINFTQAGAAPTEVATWGTAFAAGMGGAELWF